MALMETPPPGCELVRISKMIEAEQGSDSNYESTRQDDLAGFFTDTHLPAALATFTINFSGTYKGRDADGPFQHTRRIGLSTSMEEAPEVTISGEPEWILGVQDYVDSFLKNHPRDTRFQVATVWIAYWIVPIALLGLSGSKSGIGWLNVAAFLWGVLGLLVILASVKIPPSALVIRPEGAIEPWYIRAPREILVAAVGALLVAILVYLTVGG